jgi:hypothetical protein
MMPLLATDLPTRLVHLSSVDVVIVAFYFVLVLSIGWYLKGRANTGEDFFMAGREMTAWVAGLSFLSANLGARQRSSLREYGPMDHDYRRADQRRHGLPGDAVCQHHGLCAGVVQFLHRTLVRHGRARDAAEAGDSAWRILGIAVRDALFDQHVGVGESRSLRTALCGALVPRKRPGPGLLSSTLVFYCLRSCDFGRKSGDKADT